MSSQYILAIDQGTTSSRALIFDSRFAIVASAQRETTQHYPRSGWVEQDPIEIWHHVVETCRAAIARAGISAEQIAAIGITNQRETVVIWDRETGEPIHPAIVWQDRRTAAYCADLKAEGAEEALRARTGLLLDPYFSATKIRWLLDHVDGARTMAEHGRLAFGTIDSYLIWRLTGGRSHRTDATNASRTLLFNIERCEWDSDLCALFDIPMALLPEVRDCAAEYGETIGDLFGAPIPILGVAGDQQAASMGQACFAPGTAKSTYGTGCFILLNTGSERIASQNRLLTTIASRLSGNTVYALEGSIFVAGAAVQWLRDGLTLIENAAQTGQLAAEADPGQEVVLVPAFAGLGAPHWNPDARGAIYGLNRNSGPQEIARAVLESVCFQTRDLIAAMRKDFDFDIARNGLRVDGGLIASDWTMQFLADILDCRIDRPRITETTALGAAWLAGMHAGCWPAEEGFAAAWERETEFLPQMDEALRERRYANWKTAVESTLYYASRYRKPA